MAVFDKRIKLKNGTIHVMRYIRWYEPGTGKAITRSLGPAAEVTKTEAKAILAREKDKYLNTKRASRDPKLSDYIPIYIRYARDIQRKRSWDRDQTVLKNIERVLGKKKLSQIKVKDLNEYREKRLSDGRTPRTVNLEMSILSKLFKVARDNESFEGEIPVSRIKAFDIQNTTDRILSFEEERRLVQASDGHLRAILTCALNTGMRRGEIVGLKWEHIKLKQGYILLEASNTKSNRERRIPINSIMEDLFIELKEDNKSEYVFLNSRGEPYQDGTGVRKSFYKARKKADVEDLRFHDLRHTAATRMVEAGVPLFTVGQILGHSDPKTTMRYAHPDESLKEGIEALARYNRTNFRNSENSKGIKNKLSIRNY